MYDLATSSPHETKIGDSVWLSPQIGTVPDRHSQDPHLSSLPLSHSPSAKNTVQEIANEVRCLRCLFRVNSDETAAYYVCEIQALFDDCPIILSQE